MNYYIHKEDNIKGPYDTIALLRQIRNGSLNKDSLVSMNKDEKPVAASEMPQIMEIISQQNNNEIQNISNVDDESFAFSKIIKNSLDFWKRKIEISIWTGFWIISIFLIVLVFLKIGISQIGFYLGGVFAYTTLTGLIASALNLKRGRPTNAADFINAVKLGLPSSAIFGAIFSLPLLIIGFSKILGVITLFISILMLPFFILSLFYFSEKKMPFKEGIMKSFDHVKSGGADLYGLMLGFVVIGFSGVLIAILGLSFTIPLMIFSLSHVYDRLIFDNKS